MNSFHMFRNMDDITEASDTGQIYIFNFLDYFQKNSQLLCIHDQLIALRDKTYLNRKRICLKSRYAFKQSWVL